jgi:hypothetical protein
MSGNELPKKEAQVAKTTVKVVAGRVGLVRKAVERLNRRAYKLGLGQLFLTVDENVEVTKVTVDGGAEVAVSTRLVTLEGDAPVLPGYKLAALATKISGEVVVNILKCVSGEKVPDEYRTRQTCDHCKTNRNRNTYFIVRKEETGALLQVGSTCVQDFLAGSMIPAGALNLYAAAMSVLGLEQEETDEAFSTGRHGETGLDLTEFLANVAFVVANEGGFMSRGKVYDTGRGVATADAALETMKTLGPKPDEKFFETARAIEAAVEALAAKPGEKSEYEGNLIAAFQVGYVVQKTLGLVASGYVCYERALRDAATAKIAGTSKPVGSVGSRLNLAGLTVTQLKPVDGYYGTTTLVKMLTADGCVVTTFASGRLPVFEVGSVVDVRATVKEHGSYNGVAETKVNRAVFTVRDAAATAAAF